ncbi:hypothetical protein CEXT_651401 [Caerostris extrusa]|uniref:Uncharacterized protein n=1 Tax=Caerostris extrusa TaxID=172846 RepID=A0AAV4TB46_CAEEX|nr:hypothetical protein CEXT_651401 [Caerostris extrusa]
MDNQWKRANTDSSKMIYEIAKSYCLKASRNTGITAGFSLLRNPKKSTYSCNYKNDFNRFVELVTLRGVLVVFILPLQLFKCRVMVGFILSYFHYQTERRTGTVLILEHEKKKEERDAGSLFCIELSVRGTDDRTSRTTQTTFRKHFAAHWREDSFGTKTTPPLRMDAHEGRGET